MRYLATGVLAAAITAALMAFTADGHWRPGTLHNRQHAVMAGFCRTSSLTHPCHRGTQALKVAECESHLWPYATNGIYKGSFQVSMHWIHTVPGFAWNPWAQARHAYRIYRLTGGWSHWECAYLVGIL